MRALSIRLDDRLGKDFEEVCQKTGYKKNTLLVRLIDSFVRHQKKASRLRGARKDPFEDVIGLMKIEPLMPISEEIDRVVYHL